MKHYTRREWLKTASAGCAGMAFLTTPITGLAQALGSGPVRVLVGMGAGGATDSIARLYGQKLLDQLGTAVVIENKPGAFQMQAINSVKDAAANGRILYMGTGSSLSLFPAIRKDVTYDPMKDFSFIALTGISSAVITVNAALPVKTLQELVEYSAKNPGMVNYGSAGIGSANHIKTEYLKLASGLKAEHIPYKSDTDILIQVASGTVHLCITTIQSAMPFIKDGRVRALAVTAPKALSYLPGIPGTEEVGIKGLEAIEPYSYFGLVGPKGMPDALIQELNSAINKVTAVPEVQTRMRDTFYTEPFTGTPDEFKTMNQREIERARELGARLKLDL
ncbi:Bug family tripartite tricarboxylate transporter substrate binding protein [Advenella mimigardefordensis]|uniref:Putative Bug-like extracytoplasmic solute binding receptor, TTT family n=1 Tax=Advenella mimigardefordensis (strain DSM 17166 / LMG 22922 / DPN7) TaxID=1247726 RepID=W0PFR3_ADVMD|nr:tripartite tricarboxylate transporter substrate binding protein [Advenella mimigardefordensis]AHG64130.1 putative Bug-like extracytoplasmic solute binding receptor, TTT family [Advenella mimigardefordensis DPN7]